MKVRCRYDIIEAHDHEYPDDWVFGGADGLHPGADPRYTPTTYTYYARDARQVFVTSRPICEQQAIDEFTMVANMGPLFDPHWIGVRQPDGNDKVLPLTYDKATDVVTVNA